MQQKMILPPAWIGILGGGQLGMMLATVAKQFGYNVAILEADLNCPAARLADRHITTSYTDPDGLRQLAELCAVVTTEFENVPAASIEQIAQKDVPTGKPYKIVDISEIPTDRSQRNAWTVDEAELTDGVGAVWNTFDEVQP